jgi:hypothetical protein
MNVTFVGAPYVMIADITFTKVLQKENQWTDSMVLGEPYGFGG